MGTASEAEFMSIRVAVGLLFYQTKSLEACTKQADLCTFFKNHAIQRNQKAGQLRMLVDLIFYVSV